MSIDPAIVFEKGNETYNQSRLRFFNAVVPDRFPYRIIHPRSTAEVADAVKYASQLKKRISVRSGGHLFPLQHLQDDEILIDLASVNNTVEFDPKTRQIAFGPGLTVREVERFLTPQGLFFPFGHSPTVGLGGFLMAGGQGWFFPGWGLTSDRWITQMEVVTAKGDVVMCNRHENWDLFWALRGSGMGAFAVVTKFWGRTEPAKKLYLHQLTFSQKIASQAINWLLDSAKLMFPYHTEITIVTNYSDKYTDLDEGDEIKSREVLVAGVVVIYADSLEEATEMSYPFNSCPFEIVMTDGLRETSWEELFMGQELLMPPYQDLRYKCDSLLTPASAPRDKLLEAIHDILFDLPNRRSMAVIVNCGITTGDLAYSLPTDLYIANYLVWKSPTDDEKMKQWLRKAYAKVYTVTSGIYVADYDASQRETPIMTPEAWERWKLVRQKYDPQRSIGSFRNGK